MKTIRRKEIDPAGIAHECVTYTGEGGGEITFQAGNPRPVITPGPVPDHDDDPGTKETFRIGTKLKPHWENYGQELATRDEGERGLPIDYQPPHHKALGIRDHKEATAARMMEALHRGDADYFERLAKALRAYERQFSRESASHASIDRKLPLREKASRVNARTAAESRQQNHSDISAARMAGVEAIREAAEKAGGVPTVEAINQCYRASSCTNKDFRKQLLIPLGFGWIRPAPRGNPQIGET